MKLSRKKQRINPSDASQRKISSYFQTFPQTNVVLSSSKPLVNTDNVVNSAVVTNVANGFESPKTNRARVADSELLVISPSPERRPQTSRLMITSFKRKLNLSPSTKESKSKAGKLSLKLQTKPTDSRFRTLETQQDFDKNQSEEQKLIKKEDNESINLNENVISISNTVKSTQVELQDAIDKHKDDAQIASGDDYHDKNVKNAINEFNEIVQAPCSQSNSSGELKEKLNHLSLLDNEVMDCFDDEDGFEDIIKCQINKKLKKSFEKDELSKDVKERFERNGRHLVTGVMKNDESASVVLSLRSQADQTDRNCILKGFWCDFSCKEGDIVNVLAQFDENGTATVDDKCGLIVIHPDILISGTTVVSSVFCRRKAILSEWFRGLDEGQTSGVVGNIVHELFQKCLTFVDSRGKLTEEIMSDFLTKIVSSHKNILDIYRHINKRSEDEIMEEVQPFLREIFLWTKKHMTPLDDQNNGTDLQVLKIHDIEESIWSPRLGLKGKLDVTAEVKLHSRLKKSDSNVVVPLELKTGKSSFSLEHRGQVMLYSMLISEKRTNPEEGLLLYLKDSKMEEIKDDIRCQQALIRRRNEIAECLVQPVIKRDAAQITNLPYDLVQLPEPISNTKFCEKCCYLTTCGAYQRVNNNVNSDTGDSYGVKDVFLESTNHLRDVDMIYFVRWCGLLFLESLHNQDKYQQTKSIWCEAGETREKHGTALIQLILVECEYSSQDNGMHRFTRQSGVSFDLNKSGLSVGQYVVVNNEKPLIFAIGLGFLMKIGKDFIDLKLDKNLYKRNDISKDTFRIDSISMTSSFNTSLANVARLMNNTPISNRLRDLVVHHRLPSFIEKIPKAVAVKGKPIIRSLNKEQQSAIFRALMCEDYLLVKGMPGSGKTATIVALVQMFVSIGHAVLLTSHTHSAVDNILLKLVDKGIDFLRLGNNNRIDPKLNNFTIEHVLKSCKSVNELHSVVESKLVIATTCLGINHPILTQRKNFDYCIVDEASQILQAACLGPLFHSKKFILFGDSHQLPPIIRSGSILNQEDESLFSCLNSPGATIELRTQYRMNSEIVRLANVLSYGGALTCASEDVANSVLSLGNTEEIRKQFNTSDFPLVNLLLSEQLEHSVLFIDTDAVVGVKPQDIQKKLISEEEGGIVLFILQLLVKAGLSMSQIGVISPFRKQVGYLLEILKAQFNLDEVEVNTVDQFQGRDKDVIVVSCVQNSVNQNNSDVNILNDKRRINVAITRAKTKLIVIGKKSILTTYAPLEIILSNLHAEQIVTLSPSHFSTIQNYVHRIDF